MSFLDEEDLLSALLGSKKKKKKGAKAYDEDQLQTSRKSKKKKKDKKKKSKSHEHIDVFDDSDLLWEDPEKLVQLNQIVSMGSHLQR